MDLYEYYHESILNDWSCMLKKKVEDAICPLCPFQFICDDAKRKHIWNSACGCAGDATCQCGFWMDFCLIPDPNRCPYCGRTMAIKVSPMYLQLQTP